ncbi:gluconate:H+ symporter [Telmatospirillum sp.]|uniref:GntT/GntP/DsdX family permease n=1 Tax=Telmatospirillum sp. TaxID=2079197 RepID=UPI00283BA143|nr:gluconate:H+ symporter [Telmatospirillum sp.]MDR3439493.1 gluconate:H+ symporter [Telmatospirillum sp.]
MPDIIMLTMAAVAVVALIVMIARFKINPFITIFSVSVILGLVAGMPAANVVKSFETGVGNILGHIAIVVALGTMLGKMMAESGGAEQIANTLIDLFGPSRVHWAMMVIGFVVGLPVFFEVGFVLLVPIAFNVAKRTNTSMVLVGLPMVAGLSVVHGLVPPHPAALLAVTAYHADIGHTIFYALLIGLPTAALAGPIFAKFAASRISLPAESPLAAQFVESRHDRELPKFSLTLATILSPVVLMLLGSWADLFTAPGSIANTALRFIGSTDMALLLGVLLSFYTLGYRCGLNRERILAFTTECLAPTAAITLLVGAGGGFGRILIDSGVSNAIIKVALDAHVSILVLAWLLAALVRVATGSATVAMTTASGIIAPIAASAGGTVSAEILVLVTGAGSLVLSHVNDGGFWLVKEYFNMSVPQTFKTWTVLETLISVTALLLALALSTVVG